MPTTIELWAEMLEDLLPTDALNRKRKSLTWAAKFKIARDIVQSSSDLLVAHKESRHTHEGFYVYTQALDERQNQVLVQILGDFVRAGDLRRFYNFQGAQKAAENLTHNVSETYKVVIASLWMGIGNREAALRHLREGQRHRKYLWRELGDLHDMFKRDFPLVVQRYEALLQQTYPYFPPAHRAILREFVELFVFEPYDLGITYIHRNFPGAIGAFYGLDGLEGSYELTEEQVKHALFHLGVDLHCEGFSLEQVRRGASIETEHAADGTIATQIALDHLRERPDYYERLQRASLSD